MRAGADARPGRLPVPVPGGPVGFVDEPFGPARALRGAWTSRGRRKGVAHRVAHTRGPLAHKLHRTATTTTFSIWIQGRRR